jgi:hypothetical protein
VAKIKEMEEKEISVADGVDKNRCLKIFCNEFLAARKKGWRVQRIVSGDRATDGILQVYMVRRKPRHAPANFEP